MLLATPQASSQGSPWGGGADPPDPPGHSRLATLGSRCARRGEVWARPGGLGAGSGGPRTLAPPAAPTCRGVLRSGPPRPAPLRGVDVPWPQGRRCSPPCKCPAPGRPLSTEVSSANGAAAQPGRRSAASTAPRAASPRARAQPRAALSATCPKARWNPQVPCPTPRWRRTALYPHARGRPLPVCKMAAAWGKARFPPPDSPRTHSQDGFSRRAARRRAVRSLAYARGYGPAFSPLPRLHGSFPPRALTDGRLPQWPPAIPLGPAPLATSWPLGGAGWGPRRPPRPLPVAGANGQSARGTCSGVSAIL